MMEVSGLKGFQLASFLVLLLGISMVSQTTYFQIDTIQTHENTVNPSYDIDFIPAENYEEMNLSSIDLSLYLNESDAIVLGNMTVDFYNSEPVAFSSIPFHLYLSGMYAEGRLGYIDILNVTALTPSPVPLTFDVYSIDQLMWVHLDEDLQPDTSVLLEIEFESVLPTNSSDRGGVSGTDIDSSKLFEFASAYPIPCVYDEYDGWNTDPYLEIGDPFYLDMAYYTMNLTLPNAMKVAATGELLGVDVGVTDTTYHYTPTIPVREVTFCASA